MPTSHLAGSGMWCFTPPRVLLREECSPPLTAAPALRLLTHAWRNIFTCFMYPAFILKYWVVSCGWLTLFISCVVLISQFPFSSKPTLISVHTIHTTQNVLENATYKCIGNLHTSGRTPAGIMPCRDGLAISSTFEAQPIDSGKSDRLQHESTSQCQWV